MGGSGDWWILLRDLGSGRGLPADLGQYYEYLQQALESMMWYDLLGVEANNLGEIRSGFGGGEFLQVIHSPPLRGRRAM